MRKHIFFPFLAAGAMAVAGFAGGSAAAAPPPPSSPCVVGPGVTQTSTVVTGSAADDTIDCTNASPGKTINGNAGNDTITGTAFKDTIKGGDGNDTMTGGGGDDIMSGELGADTITGSEGNDTLSGPSTDGAQDTIAGGLGTDKCGAVGSAPADIQTSCP